MTSGPSQVLVHQVLLNQDPCSGQERTRGEILCGAVWVHCHLENTEAEKSEKRLRPIKPRQFVRPMINGEWGISLLTMNESCASMEPWSPEACLVTGPDILQVQLGAARRDMGSPPGWIEAPVVRGLRVQQTHHAFYDLFLFSNMTIP